MTPGAYAGQTVLITGASRGIGAHLMDFFEERGAWVAGCSRSMEAGESATRWTAPVDVTDEAAVVAWVREAHRRSGRLDVLVNNAGMASMNHSMLTPGQAITDAVALNCTAAFAASREAVKWMKRARYGRIVNLTTIAVPMVIEGELAYVASKSALDGMTRVMAREVAGLGVTLNLVGPCPVDTDLIRGVSKAKMDALLARLPLQKMATLDDVAYAVDVFCRPEAGHLTGQVLYLGGAN